MEQKKDKMRYYVTEQVEEGLFEWSSYEYMQMQKFLKPHQNTCLVFTNSQNFIFKNSEPEEQQKQQTYYNSLLQYYEQQKYNPLFLQQPINHYMKDNGNILQFNEELIFQANRVCLLDMRATQMLSPDDSNSFDVFLFGGILGDHPPRDRTKVLRKEGFQLRQLGTIQMATDQALLTSKLILEDGLKFEDIPFVDEPEVAKEGNSKETVCLEGFRYVTQEYDINTGKIIKDLEKHKQPLMSEQIRKRLLFEELDFSKM